MHDDMNLGAEATATGISRRDLLRKGAVVGGAGALMWAAPSITKFGGAAFGQTEGTPGGKGLSYIALRYSCDDGATFRYIKFDLEDGPGISEGLQTKDVGYKCTTGNFQTPQCDFYDNSNASKFPEDCDKFQVYFDTVEDGDPLVVRIVLVGNDHDCLIDGAGLGKCGNPENPKSGGECISSTSPDGNSITFADCGAS
jgi:hypothetical protein